MPSLVGSEMCIRDRIPGEGWDIEVDDQVAEDCGAFFFSSRRRHTRQESVSWARRCVQETGFQVRAGISKQTIKQQKTVALFFFQAEDGIRDRSPSRGLGDVYKRQINAEYMGLSTSINKHTNFSYKQTASQRKQTIAK
eukprot:TRINITY_DN11615_c0_g1_i2.p2 TRINITY_DN11615_c0_g1~~TRINITY_DN11615_c0_g1_i2.p2  ORF type:complete len:139 (-),score=49.26 TRINITY_DN11615_c0_g1_i2:984-1400(-)